MIISKQLPSRLENVMEFIQESTAKIEHLCPKDTLSEIRLSLEEALVNSVKHGNKFNPGLSVDVTIEASPSCIGITVKDKGEGFDFNTVEDPTKTKNIGKLSGRGLFLIKKLMDEVKFLNGGSKIEMKKFLIKRRAR